MARMRATTALLEVGTITGLAALAIGAGEDTAGEDSAGHVCGGIAASPMAAGCP
jgi:hypothetical protein